MPVATTHTSTKSGGEVDLFIKMTGQKQGLIKGESVDHQHKGEIDVVSYTWGVKQPYSGTEGGMATGKRQHYEFRFLMKTQSATPLILAAICTGEHLKEVVMTCRKAGGQQQEYMTWKFTNAMLVDVKTGYLSSDEITPYDEVSMVFQKIELEYKTQSSTGQVGSGIMFSDNWSNLT